MGRGRGRGRQVWKVGSAPPSVQSAQSVGQLAPCSRPRGISLSSSRRARPRPRAVPPASGLPAAYSVRASSREPPARLEPLAPLSSARAAWRPPTSLRSGSCSPQRRRRWPRPRKVRSGVVGLGGPGGGGPRRPRRRLRGRDGRPRFSARRRTARGCPGSLRVGGSGQAPTRAGRREQPCLALCAPLSGNGPGQAGSRMAAAAAASTCPPPSSPAHLGFWRTGNLPGPGGDSATATCGPASPRAPAVGPGCGSRAGTGGCGEASGAATHLCAGRRALTTRCVYVFFLRII